MLIPKNKPLRDKKHLKFLTTLPCVVTGIIGECDAAHIRHGFLAMGIKPSDSRCVPLHHTEHRKQHATSETIYWGAKRLDAAKWLSGLLYTNTGDYEECCRLIRKFRDDFPSCQ